MHSVLPDFDIDFFFLYANVGAPLLGLVDIVDRREVGDAVNFCVILVILVLLGMMMWVHWSVIVATTVGDVDVVVGVFVKVVGTAVSLATHVSLLYLAWMTNIQYHCY